MPPLPAPTNIRADLHECATNGVTSSRGLQEEVLWTSSLPHRVQTDPKRVQSLARLAYGTTRRNQDHLGPFLAATSPVLLARSSNLLKDFWRRRPDLNRGWRFCRPL